MNCLEGDSGDECGGDPGDSEGAAGGGHRSIRSSPGNETLQRDSFIKTAEAQEIVGDIKRRESPSANRKDLTISTLIAECEDYVKTDEFTKDFSDKLVHLFSTSPQPPPHKPKPGKPVSRPDNLSKPPKIPENMRHKTPRPGHDSSRPVPKFPLTSARSSTYDNVSGETSEVEDEGIDNDYDEADDGLSTPPGPGDKHESSPALTSEGYDSAHESGENVFYMFSLLGGNIL